MQLDLRHTIYKRKGRRGWTLEYPRPSARPFQRQYSTKVKAEAAWQDELDRRRAALGLRISPPKFGAWVKLWLDRRRSELKPGSVMRYEWAMKHLDEFAPMPLDEITSERVKDLIASKSKTLARSGIGTIRTVLSSSLDEAIEDGYLKSNPVHGRKRRRGLWAAALSVKAFTREQLQKFLHAATRVDDNFGFSWEVYFYVSWSAGLRPGEVLALRPNDIDLERRRLLVDETCRSEGGWGQPKGNEIGWVDMTRGASVRLENYLKVRRESPWLFPGGDAESPIARTTLLRAFKAALRLAELPEHFTPHCLRHTFAAMHLQAGRSIYYVQRMLRHKSIRVTVDIYGHWLDPGKPEYADALEAEFLAIDATPRVSNLSVNQQKPAVNGGEVHGDDIV